MIISVISEKGGVGKTTTTVHTAKELEKDLQREDKMNVKKFFVFVIIFSIILLCVIGLTVYIGANKDDYNVVKEPTVGGMDNETICIWTDEETGVQYVIYRERAGIYAGLGGITPRLNPDGSLYGVEQTAQNERMKK